MTEYRRTSDGVEVPDRETRAVSGLELRAEGDDLSIDGYALVYDWPYDIGGGPDAGGFTERMARGAATKSANDGDVRLLVNHAGIPLARTRSGTLQLRSDDVGLRMEAHLDPANPAVAELRSAMSRGDMDGMSIGFKAIRQSWDDAYEERTLSEIQVFDVSVVTFPANPATVAKFRSDDVETERRGRSLALARRQLLVTR